MVRRSSGPTKHHRDIVPSSGASGLTKFEKKTLLSSVAGIAFLIDFFGLFVLSLQLLLPMKEGPDIVPLTQCVCGCVVLVLVDRLVDFTSEVVLFALSRI